jgi:hypothetical protein
LRQIPTQPKAGYLTGMAVEQGRAPRVRFGHLKIGDLPVAVANGAQQEHPIHAQLHGLGKPPHARLQHRVFLHPAQEFTVEESPPGNGYQQGQRRQERCRRHKAGQRHSAGGHHDGERGKDCERTPEGGAQGESVEHGGVVHGVHREPEPSSACLPHLFSPS